MVTTKFHKGQRVRHTDTGQVGTVTDIDTTDDAGTIYLVTYRAHDNPEAGEDTAGNGYENEFEEI